MAQVLSPLLVFEFKMYWFWKEWYGTYSPAFVFSLAGALMKPWIFKEINDKQEPLAGCNKKLAVELVEMWG